MRVSGWRLFVAVSAFAVASSNATAGTIDLNLLSTSAGFTAQTLGIGSNTWLWTASSGWAVNGSPGVSLQRLLTPVFTAQGTSWGMDFTHRFNFESGFAGFDGGQVWASVNGGAFSLLPSLAYTATLSANFGNLRGGQDAFSGTSAGYATPAFITTTFSGSLSAGDTIQFAFDGAWDTSISLTDPNWQLTDVQVRDLGGPTAVPEPATLALLGLGLAALTARRQFAKREPRQ